MGTGTKNIEMAAILEKVCERDKGKIFISLFFTLSA